ncbi:MAG: RecQ family ATP-dependent DNA helicase, partial [Clostridia bacterium]|nr:RecQ family ATP-dependent DNA helicase [Clostridia bacterium]
MNALETLRHYFGHSAFRPGQQSLVEALLSGRDALGVMPTGAGKSMCYQVPALMLPGVTLVVSPLISLMKDQVAALIQAGVPAAYINSSLTQGQINTALRRAAQGQYKIIYVAPERLNTPDMAALARQIDISLLAVDEAHCVSQWGQDFRPSYLTIARFVEKLPQRPPVGAFTATATERVREDIVRLLALNDPFCAVTGFDRANLFFDVLEPKDKTAFVVDYVKRHEGQSGIVYCATRRAVEAVCQSLQARGLPATRYHAGLEDEERRRNQDDFVYDRAPVMVATNAFGMGIDKSNVSYVLHYNMPKNLESYYQEAGRAGRDGERAECVLLFSPGDVQTAKFLLRNGGENEALTPEEREIVYRQDLQRLDQMTGYCRTDTCLRAYILGYFGERQEGPCGNCGRCTGDFIIQDITESARRILEAVSSLDARYASGLGMVVILRALLGSNDKRVQQLGLNKWALWGSMKQLGRHRLRELTEQLIAKGLLAQSGGQFPTLHLTEEGRRALEAGAQITVRVRRQEKKSAAARSAPPAAHADDEA